MDWLEYGGAIAVGVMIFAFGMSLRNGKPKRPRSTIDKVGEVVLDYSYGTGTAKVIANDNIVTIKRTIKQGDDVVMVSIPGQESAIEFTMDEAYQIGRALSLIAWREQQ